MDISESEEFKINFINLVIENRMLKCSRLDLVTNSDYFRVMLEGNFLERNKNTIKLDDVSFRGMENVIYMLHDPNHLLDENSLYSVLETSCMLQFLAVKQLCLERAISMLAPYNSLKLWMLGVKLDLKVLAEKGKLLALMEFSNIKRLNAILEMDMKYVCLYLGSVNLQCYKEMEVFKSAMIWCSNLTEWDSTVLLKLLHCLNFNNIIPDQIDQIIKSRNINEYRDVVEILECVKAIKNNLEITDYEEKCIKVARSLLNCQHRNTQGYPCLIVDNNEMSFRSTCQNPIVIYHDKYKRKRKYNVLNNHCSNTHLSVIYFDAKAGRFRKLVNLRSINLTNLNGFKIVGHKQFIYIFGGEWELGKGVWNASFHTYDLIKEVWVLKSEFTFNRRHFSTVICGNYLYVITGTGQFRVLQDKILWYDIKKNIWSGEVKLPCIGPEIKCCVHEDRLFILDITNRCGHFFNHEDGTNKGRWSRPYVFNNIDEILPFSHACAMYSYNSRIFMKERYLSEFKVSNNQLIFQRKKAIMSYENYTNMEYVLCNDLLYTLYGRDLDGTDEKQIVLESFNVNTHETRTIFSKSTSETMEEIEGEFYKLRSALNFFSMFHFNGIEGDNLVNEYWE